MSDASYTFTPRRRVVTPGAAAPATGRRALDPFEGLCSVCGHHVQFAPGEHFPSTRGVSGGYACPSCGALLKYQGQADTLLRRYATDGARAVVELVQEPAFRRLRVYEPGALGPFERFLCELPGYVRSSYLTGVAPGAVVDGVRCENLMALTFPDDAFDLVITTDIFEHVRHPEQGFAEVYRVLAPGGMHLFTVPGVHPLRRETIVRVDVSGPEDRFLLEDRYHNGHLVYNDFGSDLVDRLAAIGFVTEIEAFDLPEHVASKQLTYCSVKPAG